MPKAGRLADIGLGHGCFPPSPVTSGSGDVFINSRPALRRDDNIAAHGCKKCPPHPRKLASGSSTVNINGRPAGRVGDPITCGGAMGSGSSNVIIGDTSWGSGLGSVTPLVRIVVSQVPGSTKHGYYKEPYKLYHNNSLVQEGLTDENGVIIYEPDSVMGVFRIEAVSSAWELTAKALPPADTEEGLKERLAAHSYHCSKDTVTSPNESHDDDAKIDLGWFQGEKEEEHNATASEIVRNLVKTIIP